MLPVKSGPRHGGAGPRSFHGQTREQVGEWFFVVFPALRCPAIERLADLRHARRSDRSSRFMEAAAHAGSQARPHAASKRGASVSKSATSFS